MDSNNNIIKVPLEHFERLIESCCILHRCDEHLENCECLKSIEDEYFSKKEQTSL